MLRTAIARFLRDQSGATAIEYGLIAALVAVAIISTLVVFGTNLTALYAGGTGSAATVIGNAANSL
ncbi:pilus assembly protein Flp/PilA [Devosia sp. UYZn731]|uniref:Flp family type IVb pilin n=1 Tax=Devosia sp. UYZn731 TaxID=3156345 RepID=UPI0033963FAA